MCIYIYICIYLYKSRGVAFIGYYVPDNAEKEEEGEKRERDTFFTILPTHGVSAAATLSHKGQREVIHVPIDLHILYMYIHHIYIYIYIYIYTHMFPTAYRRGRSLIVAMITVLIYQ